MFGLVFLLHSFNNTYKLRMMVSGKNVYVNVDKHSPQNKQIQVVCTCIRINLFLKIKAFFIRQVKMAVLLA